jgi:hypothetical protein
MDQIDKLLSLLQKRGKRTTIIFTKQECIDFTFVSYLSFFLDIALNVKFLNYKIVFIERLGSLFYTFGLSYREFMGIRLVLQVTGTNC